MHYDFIEIGTYRGDTLADNAKRTVRGLMIEPMVEYLDQLQLEDLPFVTKVPVAIVDKPTDTDLIIFFITTEDVQRHSLHPWMAQCNSIGKFHPWHVAYHNNPNGSGPERNLTKLGIVRARTVTCMTWKQLMKKYDVTSVDFVKIDAEGYDVRIVNSILDYCAQDNIKLPPKIQFETNSTTEQIHQDLLRGRLASLGYNNVIDGQNTISTLYSSDPIHSDIPR